MRTVCLMRLLTLTVRSKLSLVMAALAFLTSTASAQAQSALSPTALTPQQIVERIEQHDRTQTAALERYQALRHYALEYHGFFRTLTAEMDVKVNYDAVSGKSFQIISQSGSKTLCQRVLKKAVDSEKEASLNPAETALTEVNYKCRFVGRDSVNGRSAYVLDVEPIKPSKFLYRGRIWVDALDFAVARMDVQPGKNPSFWISKTTIHHTNEETGGFWLPQKNRSETKVRIGGTAVLTIDYGSYQFVKRPVISERR